MKRRSFLVSVGGAAGAGALHMTSAADAVTAPVEADKVQGLPRRVLGRTGAKVSVVGFPGLALSHCEQADCTTGLHRAFEKGINYFDVAPAYGRDGECERKMGIGLQGLDRSKYFLSCKTKSDDKQGAREELERSLKRLKTDYVDLYQLHCLQREEEVQQALAPGGALEAVLQAKQEGKVKHIGFSAHTTQAAVAALEGFDFDTCMFPINFVEYYQFGFGKSVLQLCEEKGTAVISIKPVSRGRWPKDVEKTYKWWYRPIEDKDEMVMAMRWVLSFPGVATGIPASFLDVLDNTIAGACQFQQITDAETERLQRIAATCTSVFLREQQKVAFDLPDDGPFHTDSPHHRPGTRTT